jgi:hypothetical protein
MWHTTEADQVKIADAATLAANNFMINRRFTLQRAAMQKVVSWQLIVCAPLPSEPVPYR